MSKFDNVSVIKKSNHYFDGKCVSHTVYLADGTKKTLGVIFPSTLQFDTAAPEKMEITGGICRVRLDRKGEWKTYRAGESFSVAADSVFDIEALEVVDYVCHYD